MNSRQHRRSEQRSHFDGGLLGYIGWVIFGALITVFTLGLAYPWAIVNIYRWEINHTIIDGAQAGVYLANGSNGGS